MSTDFGFAFSNPLLEEYISDPVILSNCSEFCSAIREKYNLGDIKDVEVRDWYVLLDYGNNIIWTITVNAEYEFEVELLVNDNVLLTSSFENGEAGKFVGTLSNSLLSDCNISNFSEEEEDFDEQISIVPKDVTNVTLVALRYENKVIGYRFKTSAGNFDITKRVALQYGVSGFKIEKAIRLERHNGLYVSPSEVNNKRCVPDVSDCKEDCERLFDALFS